MTTWKRCIKCKQMLPTDEFFPRKTGKDGLNAKCRRCNSIECAAHYAAHKEEMAATNAAWILANRDTHLATKAAYRAEHREEACAASAAWRVANPEKARAQMLSYRAAHPEKKRSYGAKRRALKRGCTAEQMPEHYELGLYEAQHGLCYYCGDSLEETGHHLDHMNPLSRKGAHSLANLCLACPSCNMRKHTKTAEEFFTVLQRGGVYAME